MCRGCLESVWYAMQPEPPEQDKPPSFPTVQPEETPDTSLSDRLPYLREQEAHIRKYGKVAERGNETMLVEIADLAEMYEMYADLDEGDYKPEERTVGKENGEDTSLSDRLPYIKDFEQQIRESGEVTQRGGLGNWYSKAADLAVRAYDYVVEVVETVKGYWQEREEARREQEQDKDMDMDMDFGDW